MDRKHICCTLLVALLASACVNNVKAQDGKDFARGLLRALIESQLEKARRKNPGLQDPFRNSDPRNNVRPNQLTPEMQRLRPIAASFMQESAQLAALLTTDARRNYNVIPYQTRAVQLQAAATALNQQAAAQHNHLAMIDDFRSLNSDWVALSHQLEHCNGISNQTKACVRRIGTLDEQYCSLLGFSPQFNNTELIHEAHRLETHLHDLDGDVARFGFAHLPNNQLRHTLGRNHKEAAFFDQFVSAGARYEDIVSRYEPIYQTWQSIQQDLNQLRGHHIARNVRRIQESHERIHELLGLQMAVNNDLLLHLVHETHEELTELSQGITLDQLTTLPDAAAVPAALVDAEGMLQNLDSVLHLNESPQAIANAWVYADEAWNILAYYLSGIQNHQSQQLMASISQNLESVKHSLGITIQFDRSEMHKLAHSLAEQADLLARTIQNWQSRPGKHNRKLPVIAKNIVTTCYNLDAALVRARSQQQCRQMCDQIIQLWQQIRPELLLCDTVEQQTLNHIVAEFTPDLIRLRAMLGD